MPLTMSMFNNDSNPKSLAKSGFDILKKHIYADPIESMIEALAKHAAAEQAKAGVDRAFKVYLPSEKSQTFYVRDHGFGYTREQVETVFRASSVDSDGVTGTGDMLANSPLTYASLFTVTTYNAGTQSFYTVVFDLDTGKPEPKFIDDRPVAAMIPTGTHIQVQVKPEDIVRFEIAARKILPNFNADVVKDGERILLGGVSGTAPSM